MTLEDLEEQLPWGFHDAYLARLELDWIHRTLTLELRVQIGKHQETDQLARVVVSGLEFFVALPPQPDPTDLTPADELPWIDSGSGRIENDMTPLPSVPEGCFLHYFYTRGTWQYFYVCGRDAKLAWLEPNPVP